MKNEIPYFELLAKHICRKYGLKDYEAMQDVIINFFDEVISVYGTYEVFNKLHDELEKYYLASEEAKNET